MYADEKILLTVERIIHKISTFFKAFEKRVKSIQRIVEIQVSLAFQRVFYTTKSYQRKYSRSERRKEQIAKFLSKPLEV